MPQIYVASGGAYRGMMNIHLRISGGPGAETAMLDSVRRAIKSTDERLPIISAKTMTGHRDTSIMAWSAGVPLAFTVRSTSE